MAKGSKKYAGHEYSFTSPASSGLGKDLGKQKSFAASSRAGSKTYPKKMADGGSVPVQGANTNAALSAMGSAVSNPQQAGGSSIGSKIIGMFTGKTKGGEVKKHDAKNLKQLDSSMHKFFKEEAEEKTKGGKVEARNEEEEATHKNDSKKDDKIPILASEGEFVVKRSIMNSKDAPKKAAKAIKEEKEKKGK